jgi:hypothetical protein
MNAKDYLPKNTATHFRKPGYSSDYLTKLSELLILYSMELNEKMTASLLGYMSWYHGETNA